MGFLSLVPLPPSIAQVSVGSISGFLPTQNLCTHVQVHMCTYVCTYTHECVYVCSCYSSVNTDNHSIPPTCFLPEELSIHPHPPATRGPQWEKMASCFMTTRFHYHLLVAVKEVEWATECRCRGIYQTQWPWLESCTLAWLSLSHSPESMHLGVDIYFNTTLN